MHAQGIRSGPTGRERSWHRPGGKWRGRVAGEKAAKWAGWPKTTRLFTSVLRRIAPQLRLHGLSIISSRTRDTRLIRLVTAAFLEYAAEMGVDPNGETAWREKFRSSSDYRTVTRKTI